MQAHSRIWITSETHTLLGEGRVQLLEAIHVYGSISSAAKSLGMSYKKAWKLVDIMNTAYPFPLIVSSTGGKKGGGTQVTASGLKIVAKFRVLQAECESFLNERLNVLDFESE